MRPLPEKLGEKLCMWYDAGHRELPWRQDREPYHVWLSEIMLQQTRVEAVKGYYPQWSLHNKPKDAKISPITIEEASGAAAALKGADSR